jgi:hypothetical protein
MPGIPGINGGSDRIAGELITFIELPAGDTKMGVNSDDGFITTATGPALNLFAGQFDGGRGAADTIFTVTAQEAGVYQFRTIWEEGGGGANIEWFTVKSDGTKALINDVANGGLKAYRALASPYIREIVPPPGPRQTIIVSPTVKVTLVDGVIAVDDTSITLKVDGSAKTITKNRQGNRVVVTYAPTGLEVPTDLHSAELSYKPVGGTTVTAQWQFYNLKNLVLPAASVTENFDSYAEGSQPTGWLPVNFTANNTPGQDIHDQKSDTYKDWVVISTATMPEIDANNLAVDPGQILNGQEITVLASNNVLYAESDSRDNGDALSLPRFGQTQFITSRAFNLSALTSGVVMSLNNIYQQNQDSLGAIEYSVDGGNTWLPVVYFLDSPDIKLKGDGSVDAVRTFNDPNGDTSSWTVNGVAKGGKYGDGIAAAINDSLSLYVVPRINDDPISGARFEVFRLPQAKGNPGVRLRLASLGTDSWYFAVDNIAFYDVAAPVTAPVFNPITRSGNGVIISWTGTGTLEETTALGGTWSQSPSQNNPQTVTVTTTGNKFYRLKQ